MERHSRSTFYSSLLKLKIMLPRLFICRLKISLSQSLRRHQIQVSVISLEWGLSKSLENLLSNLNDHSSKSNFYFNWTFKSCTSYILPNLNTLTKPFLIHAWFVTWSSPILNPNKWLFPNWVDISIILQKTSLVLLTKILPCIVLPQMRSNFKVTLKLSNN